MLLILALHMLGFPHTPLVSSSYEAPPMQAERIVCFPTHVCCFDMDQREIYACEV